MMSIPTNYDKSTTVRNQLERIGIYTHLNRDGVTEIAVNQPNKLLVMDDNGWNIYDNDNCSFTALMQLANALAIYNGKSISEKNPILSVILPDGERGQIVIPPACERDCVSVTIRKPSTTRFSIDDYINSERLSDFVDASEHLTIPDGIKLKDWELEMIDAKANRDMRLFFKLAVENKLNIIFVGGTGSGKTTITKAIADLVPADTRIITIEDAHELDLPNHPNRVHLFFGETTTAKDSISSCMRMRPDRVFLTELRGDEAWDYITLLNTGHPGSLTTVHANDCLGAYARVTALVKQSKVGQTLDYDYILSVIKSTLDVVCFFEKTRLRELYFDPVNKYRLLTGR